MLKQRIDFNQNWDQIFTQVCVDFDLGSFQNYNWVETGYEDVNGKLTTDQGHFFVKIFANFRDQADIDRYIQTLQRVQGFPTPKLRSKTDSNVLWKNKNIQLIVTEWINGETLHESQAQLSTNQIVSLAQTITQIHQLNYQPRFVYDSWAITSMEHEFPALKNQLSAEDLKLVEPVVEAFLRLDIDSLPKAFIHSDLNTTNLIINHDQELEIIDWGCSNYYPRIMELAVIISSLLWNPDNSSNFESDTEALMTAYEQHLSLTTEEKSALNLCTKANWAMYIILPYKQSDSPFNEYFQTLGRTGLTDASFLKIDA